MTEIASKADWWLCHCAHDILTTFYVAACLSSVSALCLGLGHCSYSWLLQSDAPCQHAFLLLIACVSASKPETQVALFNVKQRPHGCKGLEKLSNADSAASTKHPTECVATHSLSIIRGTLIILRLTFGLFGTLQSVMVCQHHPCCMFGAWHKWTVLCKPGTNKKQILTHMP